MLVVLGFPRLDFAKKVPTLGLGIEFHFVRYECKGGMSYAYAVIGDKGYDH